MRIVFIGNVKFSYVCLETIINHSGDIVAIFTLSCKDSKFNHDYVDLNPIAFKHNIPIHYIKKINDRATIAQIESLKPDVIFVFGFSQLISNEILDIPPLGCIGSHPSLLPENRGRHPLIWALVEGLSESGLTFFYLDEGADSGDILWQQSFTITLDDDAGSLYEKICILGQSAIQDFLPQLQQNNAPRIKQNHNRATYWRKRTKEDGKIIWKHSSLQIYNLIRALTHPYVGANTYIDGIEMTIWQAVLPSEEDVFDSNVPAGTITHTDGYLRVKTGDSYLDIVEYSTSFVEKIVCGTCLG